MVSRAGRVLRMEDPEFAADGVLGGIAEMQVLVSGQRSQVDWVL